MKRFALFILLVSTGAAFADRTPQAQKQMLDKVGFTQKLDTQLPLSLKFRNEAGDLVPLSSYFGDKPVLLNLVYFECPMLCTEVLNGLLRTLRAMPLTVGEDFNVLTVSFDPKETPKLAAAKKRVYLDRYGRKGAENGWAFLTGDESSIKALTDAVGFSFAWDPEIAQFAHGSGIMILTPLGKLARYFFGVEYPVKDVRLSLVEAGNGKIGSAVDQLLLYCYHYNPENGRYGVAIMRVLRLSGIAMVTLLGGFIFVMLMRDRSQRLAMRNT